MYEWAVKRILLEHMFANGRQIRRAEPSEAGLSIAHDAMTAGPDGAACRTTPPGCALRGRAWDSVGRQSS